MQRRIRWIDRFVAAGHGQADKKFANDDRFIFKMYSDRGHSYPVNSDAGRACRTQIKEGYFKAVKEGGEAAGEAYIQSHMDREGCMQLDEPLMQEILEMFDQAIK